MVRAVFAMAAGRSRGAVVSARRREAMVLGRVVSRPGSVSCLPPPSQWHCTYVWDEAMRKKLEVEVAAPCTRANQRTRCSGKSPGGMCFVRQ